MIRESDLQVLTEFEGAGAPVASLYLEVDQSKHTKDEIKLRLRGMFKEAKSETDVDEADLEQIQKFFDYEYDWQSRSVIAFSSQKQELWQVYSLAVPVEDQLHVGETPYIKPLVNLMNDYKPYGIVIVDREMARLFEVSLGEIEEVDSVTGVEIKMHKQGGWAQARYKRNVKKQAFQNLKLAVDATMQLSQTKIHFILLGGTEENRAHFKDMLPKAQQELIAGEFTIGMNATDSEIREKTEALAEQAHTALAEETVKELITRAEKGERAVAGLSETLSAVNQERVHTLIVAEGFKVSGYRCTNCNYIMAENGGDCDFCQSPAEEVEDIIALAVRRVQEAGGKVETVIDNADLEGAGNIGAILRY